MKFQHIHEKPTGTRDFDANIDNEALRKAADLMTKGVEDTQKALVPPEMCPSNKDGFFSITFEVMMVKNLTTKEKYFLASFKGRMRGTPLEVDIDTKRIAGVTPDDEVLFAAGPTCFYTTTMEMEGRMAFVDAMSQALKDSGHGGDLTRLLKEKLGKDGLFGGFRETEDPSDWWKRGPQP